MEGKSIEQLVDESKGAIRALLDAGHPLVIGFSGGKDSSVVANLAMLAAKEAALDGLNPLVVVSTGYVGGGENPEGAIHFRQEHAKMKAYGEKHGFRVISQIVTPNLSSLWQVNVLTGRSLPSFPGEDAKCSVDMKVKPQNVAINALFKRLKKETSIEPVTLLGVRFDESITRAENMRSRGDTGLTSYRGGEGKKKRLMLSPIAFWTEDDVWLAIYDTFAEMDSYTDFEECRRLYAASEGEGCAYKAAQKKQAAVAMNLVVEGGKAKKPSGCSARTGCFVCTMNSSDKSLENMTKFEPRYEYAKGLVRFNKFLQATRFDWSRRNWVAKEAVGGYVKIQPQGYSPAMLRDLYRYFVQLQKDEKDRASRDGVEPMFELITPEIIVAIDAMWSLNCIAPAFAAWKDYSDIMGGKVRYEIPEIEPVPRSPLPAARYLHVSEVNADAYFGIRDPYFESLTDESGCSPTLVTLKDGRAVWKTGRLDEQTQEVNFEGRFTVNEESTEFLMVFELDSMLKKYEAEVSGTSCSNGVAEAYRFYLQFGAISLSPTQHGTHDDMLRRAAFRVEHGLTYRASIASLLGRAVGKKAATVIPIGLVPSLNVVQEEMFDLAA